MHASDLTLLIRRVALLSGLLVAKLAAQEVPPWCTPERECCPEPEAGPVGPITGGQGRADGGGQKGPITGGGSVNGVPSNQINSTSNSNQGAQRTVLDNPGAKNAGEGFASCYNSFFQVVSGLVNANGLASQRFWLDHPGFTGNPGMGCVMWDPPSGCDGPNPLGDGCSYQDITTVDVHHGQGVTDSVCVCSPAQVGGPSPQQMASFHFAMQSGNYAAGAPVIFNSERSGAQLWWHYPRDGEDPSREFLEVRHFDGTIARYEKSAGPARLHDRFTGQTGVWWRLAWTRDPYDNLTLYTYAGSSNVLERIDYPNGLVERWNWSPSWISSWGAGFSGLEITFENSGTTMPELTYAMVFEDVDYGPGQGVLKHFQGRMRYYFAQPSTFVDDPAAGVLYDLGSVQTTRQVTEFVYGEAGTGATAHDVSRVRKFWYPALVAPAPADDASYPRETTVATTYYVVGANDGRVASQTITQLGLTTSYDYDVDPATYIDATLPPSTIIATIRITGPSGNQEIREFDEENGRVYRTILNPGAGGRPRATEGTFGITGYPFAAEPEAIRIDHYYDATCVCQKPIRVEVGPINTAGAFTAGPRVTRYEYDLETRLVTKIYSPSPATTGSGPPPEVVDEFLYHQEPGSWSPRWISRHTSPAGIVDYEYPHPIARSPFHGMMQGKVSRRFRDVEVYTDDSNTVVGDVVDHVVFNVPNNPGLGGLSYTGPTSGQPRIVVDGDGVSTTFAYDGNGRLANVDRSGAPGGSVVTEFEFDLWGRLTNMTANAGSADACAWVIEQDAYLRTLSETCTTVANVESEYYYDRWGNLAVARHKNLNSAGVAPTKHGGSSAGRTWLRTEHVWQYSRLFETRVDRRPLDEGVASPFGGTDPLMAVTQYDHTGNILKVTSQSGAITEMLFDGYGALFQTRVLASAAPGASSLEVTRVYTNGWLEPMAVVSGSPGSGAAATRWVQVERNLAGAATASIEPTGIAPAGYTGWMGGARHEYTIDDAGRTTERRILAGGIKRFVARYHYDQLSRVGKVEVDLLDSGGAAQDTAWSITSYAAGRMSQVAFTQEVNGPQLHHVYDGLGRVSGVHDAVPPGGNHQTYTYKAGTDFVASATRTLLEPGSGVTSYATSYTTDALGRVTVVKEAPGTGEREHTYGFSSLGLVDRYEDPMGRIQTFLHDALGRRVEHVKLGDDPDFIRNSATYVDTGLGDARTRMEQVDGLGHMTKTHFDFAGRQFLIQSPGANFATEPTLPGNPNQPHCVLAQYDALSQVSNLFDGDNGNTQLWYDGPGRLIQRQLMTAQEAISALNSKDEIHRDALGRIVASLATSSTNGGAVNGTLLWHDSLLHVEASTFDSLGRLLVEQSQLSVMEDPLSVHSTFAGVDRFRTGLSYDDGLGGNVGQKLDLTFTPDAVRRLSRIDWDRTPNGTSNVQTLVDYTWLGSARRSRTVQYGGSTIQATGVTTFDYDQLGRLTLIRNDVTPAGGGTAVETNQFEYAYDLANNLKKEIYQKVGGWVGDRFTYDAYHRLKDAYIGVDQGVMFPTPEADPSGYSAATMAKKEAFTLDAAQNREQVVVNEGLLTGTYQYELEQSGGASISNRYDTAHAALVKHDNRGNLIFDGNFYYRYDFLNRLQEVWRVVPTDGSQQQASGPPTGEKYAPIEETEALEDSRKEVFDEVYNLLHRVPFEHKNQAFRDQLRRTISGGVVRLPDPVTTGTGGGGMPGFVLPADLELVAVYGYDVFNRRVLRVVVGVDTYVSTYDGWREVVEHVLNLGAWPLPPPAEPIKQFVHGNGLDEVLSYRRRVGTAGSYTWQSYFVQHGGQDTPSRLLDESGGVVEQYEYDAHGKATIYNGTGTAQLAWSASRGLPFLWKSIRYDDETGLYYMRNRYYSAVTGRFLSIDPLGAWADWLNVGNGYGYVGERGLVFGDPLGLQGGPSPEVWDQIRMGLSDPCPACHPPERHLPKAPYTSGCGSREVFTGILRTIGGLAEAAAGTALAIGAGWTGLGGVAGVAVAAHGWDQVQAGLSQAISGNPTQTMTSGALQGLGIPSPVAEGIDAGMSMVGGAGAMGLAARGARGGCVAVNVEGAALRPYGGPGGGHHVPAKSAFTGAAGYDANAALAIPNAELARLGVSHSAVTGAQMTGYRAFARTGAPLTWDAVSMIETNALMRGGMASNMAGSTVTRAIDALRQAGVAGPTRIPWGR